MYIIQLGMQIIITEHEDKLFKSMWLSWATKIHVLSEYSPEGNPLVG